MANLRDLQRANTKLDQSGGSLCSGSRWRVRVRDWLGLALLPTIDHVARVREGPGPHIQN